MQGMGSYSKRISWENKHKTCPVALSLALHFQRTAGILKIGEWLVPLEIMPRNLLLSGSGSYEGIGSRL